MARDPRLVATIDVAGDPGHLAVVTEPPQGMWLVQLVTHRPPPLEERAALVLGLGLLEAVEAAHRLGLAHGALAPEAVVVTPTGSVRLDGLALAAVFPAGSPGSWTPAWATDPLVVAGSPADGASDLYAAAALIWWAATGHPPNVTGREPSGAVAAVLRRALAPGREERYPTVTDFRGALAEAAETEFGNLGTAAERAGLLVALVRTVSQPAATQATAPPKGAEAAAVDPQPPFDEEAPTVGEAASVEPAAAPSIGEAANLEEAAPHVDQAAPSVDQAAPDRADTAAAIAPALPTAGPIGGSTARGVSRARRRVAVRTGLALLALGAVALAAGIGLSFTPSAGDLPVVSALPWVTTPASGPLVVGGDLALRVTRRGPGCTYVAEATASLHGTGDLVYRFVHGSAASNDTTVHIAGNPGFAFTTSFAYQGVSSLRDTVTFELLRPVRRAVTTAFDVRC